MEKISQGKFPADYRALKSGGRGRIIIRPPLAFLLFLFIREIMFDDAGIYWTVRIRD